MKGKSNISKFRSFVISYGFTLLFVVIALFITLFIFTFVKTFASPLFLVVIVIVAWKYGLKPGVFATIISGLCIDYFFIDPQYQLSGHFDDLLRISIFGLEGCILCWLVNWRTKATEEINESREQLLALSIRQNTLREEERKKIALEIHDELGQALTGLKMEVHLLNKQINKDNPAKSGEIGQRIEDISYLIDNTIATVRRISTELRPPILDDLGLIAAIEWQTQEFQRRTGITCVLSSNIENIDINGEYSTAIFRIFQETLTNIIRHAEATTITVMLKKLNHQLLLRVEDDGKGINLDNINNSLGILGMRERSRIIGGELEVFNGTENGTVVLLTAPLTHI